MRAAEALTALGRIATLEADLRSCEGRSRPIRPRPGRPPPTRSLACAQRQLAAGHRCVAGAIYDAVRAADVPEAGPPGRNARGDPGAGASMLAEQLKSDDDAMFVVAIGASRLLPDRDVTQLLLGTLGVVPPGRQALVITALERRGPGRASRRAEGGGKRSRRGPAGGDSLGRAGRSVERARTAPALAAREPALAERHRPAWQNWLARASIHHRGRVGPGQSQDPGRPAGRCRAAESSPPRPPPSRRPTIRSPRSAWPRSVPWGESSASKSFRPWWPVCWPPEPRTRSSSSRRPSRPPVRGSPIVIRVSSTWPAWAAACPSKPAARRSSASARSAGPRPWASFGRRPQAPTRRSRMPPCGPGHVAERGGRTSAVGPGQDPCLGQAQVGGLAGLYPPGRQMDLLPDRRLAMCEEALRTASRDNEKRSSPWQCSSASRRPALALAACLDQPGSKEEAAKTAVAVAEKIVGSEPRAVAAAMQQVLGEDGQPAAKPRRPSPSWSKRRPRAYLRQIAGIGYACRSSSKGLVGHFICETAQESPYYWAILRKVDVISKCVRNLGTL